MPMQRNSARPFGLNAHQLGGEVRVCGGGGGVESDCADAEDFDLAARAAASVDEQVVAQLQRRLIEGSAQRLRAARREHRHFRIVDKNIARLVGLRVRWLERLPSPLRELALPSLCR